MNKVIFFTLALFFVSIANANDDSYIALKNENCKGYQQTVEFTAELRDKGIPQSQLIEIALKAKYANIREQTISLTLAVYHQTYLSKSELSELSYNVCMRSTQDELNTLKLF